MTDTLALADIDLSNHDHFVEAVPHGMFALLRHEDPVHFNAEPDGPGFWAVTRYEDIKEVHRDWQTFSSEIGGNAVPVLEAEAIRACKSMLQNGSPRPKQIWV